MLKKKLLKKAAVIGMMATMITGCSQEVQTTHVDGLNSLGKIEVVSREEESGTRNVFAEKTGILDETTGKDKATDQSIVADSNETAYEKTAEDKNAIAYVSSGVELDDNKVKTVTIYGNDLTRSFYLAYKGELNDVEDDFVRYISTQGQEVVSEKYTAVAKPGSFLSDKAGGEIKIGGSTSATPLVKELADKYMEINPNAKITVTETDSGNGLTGAMELCLKSGNAVILKGGSEAMESNKTVAAILAQAAEGAGIPAGSIQFIDTSDRQAVQDLIHMNGLVDVVIPRGGAGLIQAVVRNASVPVIETGAGVCHTYVDKDADVEMAMKIAFNAKVQRPSVCNAMETLLVHKDIADKFLPMMLMMYNSSAVEICGDEAVQEYSGQVHPVTEEDWSTEYGDLRLSVKIVDSIEEAMAHIAKYGTGHSECIVTNN